METMAIELQEEGLIINCVSAVVTITAQALHF